jgi:uncharacterized membrane protein
MNKQQYLGVLRQELKALDPAAVADILADFEEHFANGLALGKSEDEITADLGSPVEIARQYLDGAGESLPPRPTTAPAAASGAVPQTGQPVYLHADQQASQPGSPPTRQPIGQQTAPPTGPVAGAAAPAAASTGKVNESALVMVILFNILLGIPIWIALFSTLFGCWVAAGGIGAAAIVLFIVAVVQTGITSTILILFGLSLIALTVLSVILMFYLSKWLVRGLVHYIRWNKKLVIGGQPA